jgi:hypothetical protein
MKFVLTVKQVRHRKGQDLTIFRKCLLKNFHKKAETLQAAKNWHGICLIQDIFSLKTDEIGPGQASLPCIVRINLTCFRNSTCRLHTLQQHLYRACGIKERIKYFEEIIFQFYNILFLLSRVLKYFFLKCRPIPAGYVPKEEEYYRYSHTNR